MAGLKKKKKEKSTSPNVVLVVFLVLFVLTSIGLGVWGYYGYAGQEKLSVERKNQKNAADTEKNTAVYYSMLWRELRTAIQGDKLDPDEKTQLEVDQAEFRKGNAGDGGRFRLEKTRDVAVQVKAEVKKTLGLPDDAANFDKNFIDEYKAAQAKIKQIEGNVAVEVAKNEKLKEQLAQLTKNQDKFYEEVKGRIGKDNDTQVGLLKAKSDEFKKQVEMIAELNKQVGEAADKFSKAEEDYNKQLKQMARQIAILKAEKVENLAQGGANNPGGAGAAGGGGTSSKGDLFPLMLDISPGKPLWDNPVGKIIRTDIDLRQVTINLGSVHGVRPELTFNVFSPNSAGRAEKQLKGTIEVIKVDLNSSTCRITSMFDAEGIEMLMNVASSKRVIREAESPIREGDLLFNLFWGTRVAVAGYVSITGEEVANPAEQVRQMDDFMSLCRRNGMVVDAYVDLRNGKIEGKITSKTRYLIRGADLIKPGQKNPGPMAKKDDDDKDKDKDKDKDEKMDKEPAKDEGGLADRIDAVNKAGQILRHEARDKGLLLISAENFANVIGYRKARSANSVELSGFRPQLPYAAAPREGGVIIAPEAAPKEQPKEDPKEMEKKDQKKDPDNN